MPVSFDSIKRRLKVSCSASRLLRILCVDSSRLFADGPHMSRH